MFRQLSRTCALRSHVAGETAKEPSVDAGEQDIRVAGRENRRAGGGENEQRGTQVSGKFLTRSISGVDEATSNM